MDLSSLVRDWEASHTPKPKSGLDYAGLQEWPPELLEAWLVPDEWKAQIFVCGGCLEWGCWSLLAHLMRQDGHVIWSHFEQPRRGEWSYDGLGPFVFDAELYDTQVKALLEDVRG
ncbi:hypothetical protein [Deinococcus phoenicis]|uniref:hypothetical protein n=1 Tax=Deinococcus phoenicis TaxID=1476583 RepID=UPI00054FF9A6|nr:hypothetical protein [Deinococcus phoenicis]